MVHEELIRIDFGLEKVESLEEMPRISSTTSLVYSIGVLTPSGHPKKPMIQQALATAISSFEHTVDGRNPATLEIHETPREKTEIVFISTIVQDFFHQQ